VLVVLVYVVLCYEETTAIHYAQWITKMCCLCGPKRRSKIVGVSPRLSLLLIAPPSLGWLKQGHELKRVNTLEQPRPIESSGGRVSPRLSLPSLGWLKQGQELERVKTREHTRPIQSRTCIRHYSGRAKHNSKMCAAACNVCSCTCSTANISVLYIYRIYMYTCANIYMQIDIICI
jgi:hypothetical protein